MISLNVDGISVSLGGQLVLRGIGFGVESGDVLALLGTNGAGKSTVLNAVMGHIGVVAGSVRVDDCDVTGWAPNRVAALGVAHVPGGASSFPSLTVDDHLRMAAWRVRAKVKERRPRIAKALDRLPVVAGWRSIRAGDLSGGEQQLLALAMALVQQPRLLLLDELSLGLSPAAVTDVCALVRELCDGGCAVVAVDQSAEVCARIADRAVFLERGEVRFSGELDTLRQRPDLLRSVFLAGAATTRSTQRISHHHVPAGAPTLRVEGVRASPGGVEILHGVDLVAAPGHVVGLVGPNGAGKTTLLDVMSGFERATAGTVTLGDDDVSSWRPERRARAGIGRSLQDSRLAPALTVRENVALGFDRSLAFPTLAGAVVQLPVLRWQDSDLRLRVDDLLGTLGLSAWRDQPVSALSTGTRRLVQLAITAAHKPSVLLLDEPSAGLAAAEVDALAGVLASVHEQLRCAVVIVEHDLGLVRAVADEVVVLAAGSVAAAGPPDEVLVRPDIVELWLGVAPTERITR